MGRRRGEEEEERGRANLLTPPLSLSIPIEIPTKEIDRRHGGLDQRAVALVRDQLEEQPRDVHPEGEHHQPVPMEVARALALVGCFNRDGERVPGDVLVLGLGALLRAGRAVAERPDDRACAVDESSVIPLHSPLHI